MISIKVKKLSQIIARINSITGKTYDNDVAVKAMLQIKNIMMRVEKNKISAKSNTEKDFEFSDFDNIDDTLIEGLEHYLMSHQNGMKRFMVWILRV